MLAADGTPLKVSIQRALRRQKLRAVALVAPLFLFICITFLAPIADMLLRSVQNNIVPDTLPQTVVALEKWNPDSGEVPGEDVFAALYADLKVAVKARTHTRVASRLNYESPGIASLFRKTGRRIKRMKDGNFKEQFLAVNKDWGNLVVWQTIHRFSGNYTSGYFLASVDAEETAEGVSLKPEDERIYLYMLVRTMILSVIITFTCVLLGYPVAFILAALPLRTSNLLMILVLLPFWTSLLVRTSSWIVLLQQQGVINDLLVTIGLISDQNRLELMYNQTGTVIAMTHILLPFMVLPLYSVMRPINPSYVRAARSLGATSWTAFRRIYFPQTVPGIGAGALLVFILAVGYYITPALVGGADGQLISNLIAFHMQKSLNWSLAAALAALLLGGILILYWLYDKLVGIDNLKLG